MAPSVTILCVLVVCLTLTVRQSAADPSVGDDSNANSIEDRKDDFEDIDRSDKTVGFQWNPLSLIPPVPRTQCGENEVYAECKQNCPRTCDKIPPRHCPEYCTPGCDCLANLYRNRVGRCVPLIICVIEQAQRAGSYSLIGTFNPLGWLKPYRSGKPSLDHRSAAICGPNSSYDSCSNSCVSTCERPDRVCAEPAYCEPGCRCDKGFVKNEKGNCVRISEC